MSRNTSTGCGPSARPDPGAGPRTGIAALLFPDEPRTLPGRRWLKIGLRAAHVLSAGVATGGYLFDVAEATRSPWMIAASASGMAILLLDLYESGAFLAQTRGLIVLAKFGLLGALPWFGPWQGWILAAIAVVSVLSSHASSKVRYFVVFGRGRLKGAETKG